VAYLQAVDAATRKRFVELEEAAKDPAAALRAIAGAVGDRVCADGFRGCAFINAAAEYPEADAPVRRAIAAHRRWLFEFIQDLFARAGHPDPAMAARTMIMLRDGTTVAGYLATPEEARRTLIEGVDGLVRAARVRTR